MRKLKISLVTVGILGMLFIAARPLSTIGVVETLLIGGRTHVTALPHANPSGLPEKELSGFMSSATTFADVREASSAVAYIVPSGKTFMVTGVELMYVDGAAGSSGMALGYHTSADIGFSTSEASGTTWYAGGTSGSVACVTGTGVGGQWQNICNLEVASGNRISIHKIGNNATMTGRVWGYEQP